MSNLSHTYIDSNNLILNIISYRLAAKLKQKCQLHFFSRYCFFRACFIFTKTVVCFILKLLIFLQAVSFSRLKWIFFIFTDFCNWKISNKFSVNQILKVKWEVKMRPTSLDRFRVNSPRPAYEANVHNINEGSLWRVISVFKKCSTIISNLLPFRFNWLWS